MTYTQWRSLLRSGLSEQQLLVLMPPIAGGAGETVTTFTNVLKEYYPAGSVVNQLNLDTYLLAKVERAKDFKLWGSIGGRYFFKAIRTGLSGAVGARAENAALPTAGNYSYSWCATPSREDV